MKLQQELYISILDNMYSAILLLDSKLCLRYMNASAESLLAVSALRYEGVHISQLFSENGDIPDGLIKAAISKQQFTKRETTLRLPTPNEITVDYTVTPMSDNHQLLMMEIQPLDRAMKISQEKMLLSSQAISRTLVRGLAHEIKNPLGGLRGAAQLLEKQLDNTDLKEYTHIIIHEADRLRKLVDQMLGPHKTFHPEDINIHVVLEHVRKLIIAETQSRIAIHTDYDPSLPNITGDKEQLIQAFLNIARNAMQALSSTENPEITLRTRIQRKVTIGNITHRLVLRIDIADNGIGIPIDIVENIFFPMVTGRSDGTGLGLSISQSIITQHQGLIKFESQPGDTTFSLFLPLELENHDEH
jgi:two-component system nitrogen regulation sensor histidine kinase GlnL